MDFPNDPATYNISNQFMVGDNMLVAPVVAGETKRKIYLPEGDWYSLWTLTKFSGKSEYTLDVPIEQIPVFIKGGTILPLAKPTLHTNDPGSWELTAFVFGENVQPAVLFEDDGSLVPELKEVRVIWDNKSRKGRLERVGKAKALDQQYTVVDWKFIS
jgi:alpha-D-xyloside xylohydrolase